MKWFSELPWRENLYSLISFGLALIAMIVAIIFRTTASLDNDHAKMLLQQQTMSNSEARYNVEILSEELHSYLVYRMNGFIGEPLRLDWVESLQAIINELELPNVQYTLKSTRLISELDSPQWDAESNIVSSEMHVTFDVNNEVELAYLMDYYAKRTRGLFSIEECEIKRNNDLTSPGYSVSLKGSCLLIFYTLKDVIGHWSESGV